MSPSRSLRLAHHPYNQGNAKDQEQQNQRSKRILLKHFYQDSDVGELRGTEHGEAFRDGAC